MKKKFILLPFVAGLVYILMSSYSGGPASFGYERTGASGPVGCGTGVSGCHSDAATTANTISIQLLNGATPVTTYVGGQSLTIRVTSTNGGSTTLANFGFQLSARLTASATNAGTFTAISSTHTTTSSGVNIVEHGPQIPATTLGGAPGATYVVNIPWTAPAAGSGGVMLRSVMNLVDGGGAGPGDKWNNTSSGISELGAITGTASVCVGSNVTLANTFSGGTWTSGSTNATVNLTTGVVTGSAAGTATITYTGGANFVTRVVTVNANPNPSIGGSLTVCQGQTTTLTNSVSGGTWSSASGNVSVTTGGAVTGVTAGNAVVTYAIGSCFATATVTVNAFAANTGTLAICEGGTTLLNNTISGGVWSSSSTLNATVNTAGLVTGVAAGTANISYALPSGCVAVSQVSVNAQPSAVTVATTVCNLSTVTATNSVTGGTWSASSAGPGAVNIDATTGVVTGSLAGATSITYTLAGGCFASAPITVNPLPAPILGGFSPFCAGSSITLTSTTSGGTWASNNTAIATVGATGVTTGVSAAGGTTVITYTLATGCRRQANITVNGLSAISGTLTLCPGQSTTLSSGPAGGTWSGGPAGVATVGAGTGVVSGVSGGTAGVTYTTTSGCTATAVVTVGAASPITGGNAVCVGSALALSDASTGGTWSSSNTAAGTIGATTGILTGIATGTTTITYTTSGSCFATSVVTVNAAPGLVTGAGGGAYCNSTTISASGGSGGTIYYQGTISGGTSITTPASTQLVTATGIYYFRAQSAAGCWGSEAAIAVTINPIPADISGPASVCSGATIALTNTTGGGTWASSGNATVGATTGIVTGGTAGTATITYTVTATGCGTTTTLVVNPAPGDYTTTAICEGGTTTVATTPTGGTWSSSNTAIATIGSLTGLVTGIAAGIANITYTLATGCTLVKVQSVNAQPSPITGTPTVCVGSTTALGSSPAGGTWLSSDATKATVGSGTGIVTGQAAGTAFVLYTLATGCSRAVIVTVNALPGALGGSMSVCAGNSFVLTTGTSGGAWTSGNTAVVTINATSGATTAVAPGSTNITYTSAEGCSRSIAITVNANPVAITGNTGAICAGASLTLANATSGGTWVTGSSAVTVGAATGVVTGAATGIAVVSYTLGTGCFSTTAVSVNPSPAAITGILEVCNGANTALANSVSGGTWSSGNTAIATVGATGVVSGAATGTANITYTLTGGCNTAKTITVNPVPAAITGTGSTCVGTTTALATTSTGGVWTSANTGIATVGSNTGIVTGVAVNTTTITYAFPATGCLATKVVSVTAAPSAGTISGSSAVCTGLTIALTDAVSGGAWTASNSNATVSASGVVTGVVAGAVTITYTVTTSCGTVFATKDITVTNTAVAGTIGGATAVCAGSTGTLSSTVSGGTWASSNTAIAPIASSTGVVTGAATGTATITYTVSGGCGTATSTAVVTVNALPAAPGGTQVVCAGSTTTLTNTAGTWASANTGIATVGSGTGIVTGVSAGAVGITFTQSSTGCATATAVTVNALPAAIGGTMAVCAGTTTSLTNATTGGTWTSGNTSVAIISSTTGLTTALSAGTSTISYTLTTGCMRTAVFTVNAQPATISGTLSACVGATTTLANAATGGSWTSSNTAVAGIDATTAVVTGVSAGTSVITYTLPTTCRRTAIVTINALPAAISGTATLCAGATTTLSSSPTGGIWTSGNTTIATAGSLTGVVSGLSAGVAGITYTAANSCATTTNVTINAVPQPITGINTVCAGSTTTLANATTGGVWLSGGTTIATVGAATGVVAGLTAGTATISYSLPTGCFVTTVVTVTAIPTAFTGTLVVCSGNTTTLGSTPAGGSWASGVAGIATIGSSTGMVMGISAGTTPVTYMAGGCMRIATVTVNALPTAITGTSAVCIGAATTMAGAPTGGSWASSATGVAIINAASGIATGIAAGTATLTYTLGTGCALTSMLTVNALPVVSGSGTVCAGAATTLTSSIAGGTWSSGTTAVATIGSGSGIVSGVVAGTATLTYTTASGCIGTAAVTVNPLPVAGAIIGSSTVCVGAATTLTDATTGGTWSATNAHATISATGVVTGITNGVDTVVCTVTTVCGTAAAMHIITINPLPVVGAITGSSTACVGMTIALANTVAGGVWGSSNLGIASVSAIGVATGVATGSATISYAVTNSCGTATATVNVAVLPAADAGSITGADSVCQGFTVNLFNAITGGTWSSTATSIATVSAIGEVAGIAPGTTTVRYIVSNTCSADTAAHTIIVRSAIACSTGIGIQPVTEGAGLKVYPNPNSGSFTVDLPALQQEAVISIIDVLGKVTDTRNVATGTTTVLYDMKNIVPGNYMIKINAGAVVYRQQLTVK